MTKLDVAVFGEAMAMFIADAYGPLERADHYTRDVAGAELNVAVGLSRLGYHVGWMSRLGADPFGRYILRQVGQAGVDTSRVIFDDQRPTGFQLKSRVRQGDPEVVYYRHGSAASHMAPNPEDDAYLRGARHLHVTGIPPALSESARAYTAHAIAQARTAGITISFDPNLRPSLWRNAEEMRRVLNALACQADWVFPGLAEGVTLTGFDDPERIAHFYLDRGVQLVAVKLEARGARLFTATRQYALPAFAVQVVDTVGAGDGFAVGVISGMLDGLDLPGCLERGNAIGALAVTVQGDQEGLPTREALVRFLSAARRPSVSGVQ